ncbi:hypothetical protein F2P56_026127 [Juglans regia]|uniref:2-oxoglutarate-dependent dioxygenase DAO n=2 Tax=Juglans regia TaxID=51240 RepID=A0A833TCN0_JUGRE|nr:probable 2-oxoglutarate-dependent dioxygenase AOP1 [Juglans regia]KAF5456676.1 hypothetical protein F2P56_026127 [Juglans regia]
MGSYSHIIQVPVIKLSMGSDLNRGSEGWHNLCKRVREACENYGCFEVIYDKIPIDLRTEAFSAARQLFDLPLDAKQKGVNPTRPSRGYMGQGSLGPLYEAFAIEDGSNYDSLKSFTEVIWSDGNDQFCQAFISMVKLLDELEHILELMILDAYGLGEKKESILECKSTLLRLMKYKAPPSGESMEGLRAHIDTGLGTILCEDQISGLEIETKDGQWIKLSPSPSSFVFFVGDCLMAWSNCRMHAVKHRVTMGGDKDRYSFGAFAFPVDGSIVKAPKEFIDEEHPQLLREFDFADYVKFYLRKFEAGGRDNRPDHVLKIFAFAGI